DDRKPVVIALHCSGGTRQSWETLASALGPRFAVIAPDLTATTTSWNGKRPFTASDEAATTIAMMDAIDAPVHLVGHSYGGGVALRIARERPSRIASLSLYEPTAFHVLRTMGEDGHAALDDIRKLAREVAEGTQGGAFFTAGRRFVEFWNGFDAWDAMSTD